MSDDTETFETTVDAPVIDSTTRRAFHGRDVKRALSLHDGPSLAFTTGAVRLYDSEHNEFVEIEDLDLVRLLAQIYLDGDGNVIGGGDGE